MPPPVVSENGYDEHADPADVDASPSDSGHSGDIETGVCKLLLQSNSGTVHIKCVLVPNPAG